jgi:type I restriction enzyme S subunit
MVGERHIVPASEYCSSVRDGTHASPKPVSKGQKLVTSKHITSGRIDRSSTYLISQEDFDEINKRSKVDKWDVLISMIGTVGAACLVDEEPDFAIKNIGLFKNKSDIKGKWLYYYLQTPNAKQAIRGRSYGTTQSYISLGNLRELPILVPDEPNEMAAIAHILGTLDDKIELNRKVNQTLEEIAQALFKSWFVDFDPVRAKAEGRDTGLPEHIAALFPVSFEDSELGQIPAGWTTRGIDEIADFLNGLALQKYPPDGTETIPVIKIAQLRKGDTTGADECNTQLPPEYIIENGDVLFSWSGSLECVFWAGGKGALNQHLFKVSSAKYPQWFFYYWIHEHLPEFRRIASGKATTMGHIQRHHLSDAKVVVPPDDLLDTASTIIKPLVEKLQLVNAESQTLVMLRDALLPELISGELSIVDAERFLGDNECPED